jgi:hypothetical protein
MCAAAKSKQTKRSNYSQVPHAAILGRQNPCKNADRTRAENGPLKRLIRQNILQNKIFAYIYIIRNPIMKKILAVLFITGALGVSSCELPSNAAYTGNFYSANTHMQHKAKQTPQQNTDKGKQKEASGCAN